MVFTFFYYQSFHYFQLEFLMAFIEELKSIFIAVQNCILIFSVLIVVCHW